MATTVKKKSPVKKSAKKKPALKKSKQVNPWLIAVGAITVAIVGALIVRFSFAGSWPYYTGGQCGLTNRVDKYSQTPILKQGDRGYCVKFLQNGLKAAGFMKSSADGIFGPKTGDSVLLTETYYRFKVKDRVASKCTFLALQGVMYYGKANVGKVQSYVRSQGGNCF